MAGWAARVSFEVLKAGVLDTIQDAGRTGHRHLGVPVSGCMDLNAMHQANRLVGNPLDAAVLEITLQGPTLRSHCSASLAVCGAQCEVRVNGRLHADHATIDAVPGDEIQLGALRRGARACVAVAGGFDIDPVLGSCSTLLLAAQGGLHGRALMRGDLLPVLRPACVPSSHTLPWHNLRDAATQLLIVHTRPGPDSAVLPASLLRQFFNQTFRIEADSNRMGYRLQSIELQHRAPQVDSACLLPGTVQLTPSGQCILAMRDAQTTGGYPRLAVVDDADVNLLGQARAGDSLRFFRVS